MNNARCRKVSKWNIFAFADRLEIAFREQARNTEYTVKAPRLSSILMFPLLIFFWAACTPKNQDKEQTLFLHLREQLRSFDPVLAKDIYSQRMVLQIYEGLLHFNYLKRPVELEPLLADGMPQMSADGKTITIKIKHSIFFADDPCFSNGKGRELTAADFVYSWKRLADSKNKSESYWIFRDKIVGYDEWRKHLSEGKATYDTPIAGIRAPDKYTLVVELKERQYELLYLFTHAATTVVPHEAVEHYGEEFSEHPVGTGAFRLASWDKNSKITLVKNENYHDDFYPKEGAAGDASLGLLKNAGEKLPFAHKVVVHEISEEQPQWLLFNRGDLDLWQATKDYQPQILDGDHLAKSFAVRGIKMSLPVSTDVTYIGFNTENKFLKNKKIRQAMAMAYDQALLAKRFYNALVISAHGPIPPNVEGYRKNIKNKYQQYNLAEAKKYLSEAGYPGGKGLPPFVFEMASMHTTARQMAEFFKQQMAQLGIQVKLQTNTWPQFNEKLKTKKADIFDMAWNGDYPDAENFLQLFYSKNISPGPNSTNFSSPEFDKLFEEMKHTLSGAKRKDLIYKMEDLVMEEVPWIFNFHRVFVFVEQPWFYNFKYDTMIMDTFKYYRVDDKQRQKDKER